MPVCIVTTDTSTFKYYKIYCWGIISIGMEGSILVYDGCLLLFAYFIFLYSTF